MAEDVKNIRPRKSNIVKDVVSGRALFNLIVKHRGYIFFLFVLGLLYIGMHDYMEKTVRETRRLEQDLTDLRIEYTTRSSELMLLSRRSEIIRQVKQRGLSISEPQYPPKRIKIK